MQRRASREMERFPLIEPRDQAPLTAQELKVPLRSKNFLPRGRRVCVVQISISVSPSFSSPRRVHTRKHTLGSSSHNLHRIEHEIRFEPCDV